MRRHRPAYLAPSRTHTHKFPCQQQSIGCSGHDLNIPLLVEIPQQSTPEVVSPPSSVGSESSFHPPSTSTSRTPPRVRRTIRRRIVKQFFRLYHFLLDLLLLIFVCIMGLFFDVEVQVVKRDRRRSLARGRGSGRVVIQTRDHDDEKNQHYLSSNLLKNPPRSPDSSLGPDYWYRGPGYEGTIV
jgi:hypothetical protein